jgi:hypothetical protein
VFNAEDFDAGDFGAEDFGTEDSCPCRLRQAVGVGSTEGLTEGDVSGRGYDVELK